MRRGFTLIEMMLVSSLLALVVGGAYQLIYAARFSLRVSEVELQLSREAALIRQAWRQDGTAASAVRFGGDAIAVFETRDGPVRWTVSQGALLREDAAGTLALAVQVSSAEASRWEKLSRLQVRLVRPVADVERTLNVDAVVAR